MNELKGISIEELTAQELKNLLRFDRQRSYRVPVKTKHQLVYSGNRYVGIAISDNGRIDFRQFNQEVIYTICGEDFVGMAKVI